MIVARIVLLASGCTVCLCCARLPAQERFDLQVPGTQVRSRAELTARTLTIIDAEGQNFVYTRHRDSDSRDGTYVGFLNSQLRRAIRWPITGRGAFHIGSVSPGGQITFRESQMQISRIGPAPVTALRPSTPGRAALPIGPTYVAPLSCRREIPSRRTSTEPEPCSSQSKNADAGVLYQQSSNDHWCRAHL
ncbi:MAG: hypothetical protein CMJ64_11155 [Planctomycetaceae bacterium]|nr:hypothetical protein [Planctomycetaceae bacterium]